MWSCIIIFNGSIYKYYTKRYVQKRNVQGKVSLDIIRFEAKQTPLNCPPYCHFLPQNSSIQPIQKEMFPSKASLGMQRAAVFGNIFYSNATCVITKNAEPNLSKGTVLPMAANRRSGWQPNAISPCPLPTPVQTAEMAQITPATTYAIQLLSVDDATYCYIHDIKNYCILKIYIILYYIIYK